MTINFADIFIEDCNEEQHDRKQSRRNNTTEVTYYVFVHSCVVILTLATKSCSYSPTSVVSALVEVLSQMYDIYSLTPLNRKQRDRHYVGTRLASLP